MLPLACRIILALGVLIAAAGLLARLQAGLRK